MRGRGAYGGGGISASNFMSAFGMNNFFGAAQKAKIRSSLKHMDSFDGKNIIITGATGGIGSEVVAQLAQRSKRNILIVRMQPRTPCLRSFLDRHRPQTQISQRQTQANRFLDEHEGAISGRKEFQKGNYCSWWQT